MAMLASTGLAVVQSSASSFDGGGLAAVAVAAVVAIVVFYRIAAPLMKAAVHILEFFTNIAIKLGVGLMALGAMAFLAVIGYGALEIVQR
jgi:hypothetical protein